MVQGSGQEFEESKAETLRRPKTTAQGLHDIVSKTERTANMSAEVADSKKVTGAAASAAGVVCVLDMGEQNRKRIKRLRRGGGKLMGKVEDAVTDLQNQGVLGKQVQTVVVVVREEGGVRNLFSS
jgi:uncharacterized protein (UPF0335 family)